MTIHQELSKLRKEEISPRLSKIHCQKYVEWHKQATPRMGGVSAYAGNRLFTEGEFRKGCTVGMRRLRPKAEEYTWQKLEELDLSEGMPNPKKQGINFKKGTKLLREYHTAPF